MNYNERLQNVSVLGAAGKMGSGILLLTAVEMADLSLQPENKGKAFVINAIDLSDESLNGLRAYLKAQITKIAEKKIGFLRKAYEDRDDLIENGEIIQQYVVDVQTIIRPTKNMETAYESNIIFEAIKEDPDLKVKIFSQINQNSKTKPWFLTNTSSIPISNLDKEANLDGRIIGFHFYNPPAVQKLVELIEGENTVADLTEFSKLYAKNLRKVLVPSNDIAGFIGNGHFMRDALHGIKTAENIQGLKLHEAIYAMNKISQEFLVRPMGIFQLIDYVGIEVCQYIMSVMNPYNPSENIHSELLDKMVDANVLGGQKSSGAQKDGFLKYDKGRPIAVFDLESGEYIDTESFAARVDDILGELPKSLKPWKVVNFSPDKKEQLEIIFSDIASMETEGAKLAKEYMRRSNDIGEQLVKDGVANNTDDVNTVMLTGFFHAYGPVNNYLK
jgi:3-hydroxyacyl-CoA dehydrogenase